MSGAESYREAYPRSSAATARNAAADLLARREIKAEIARLQAMPGEQAGPVGSSLIERRMFFARVVRAAVETLEEDAELWQSITRADCGVTVFPVTVAQMK